MPTRDELLASNHTVEEIRQHLGVDSLGYLSLEGLHAMVEEHGPFCDACWTANYPAPLIDIELGHEVASAAG
jgi:amidophosphoribosyltransferase